MVGRGEFGLLALVLCASGPAQAQEPRARVQASSTLGFWFGDDDILHHDAASPAPDIANRPGPSALAEERVARTNGRESQSELALRLTSPGFFERLDTSAELRARVDWSALLGRGVQAAPFEDASSFVRMSYLLRAEPRWSLNVTGYPIDADRVRLGYLRDLSWGGSDVRRDESVFPGLVGSAPAATLGFESPAVDCWLGLKTARLDEASAQGAPAAATNYGALAGVSARSGALRLELGLGGFQQGRFAAARAQGVRRLVLGSSARVTLARGPRAPRTPGLFALNAPPPLAPSETLRPGWAVSLEASVLAQRLTTPEGGVLLSPERGAALSASVAFHGPWLALLAEYRDTLFVLRNAPGFIAAQTLPAGASAQAELSAVLELGYFFRALHCAPSLELGVRRPAAVSTLDGSGAQRAWVVQGPHAYSPLGPGQSVRPMLAARAGALVEASELLDFLGWLEHVADPNAAAAAPPERRASRRLGAGFGLRARF